MVHWFVEDWEGNRQEPSPPLREGLSAAPPPPLRCVTCAQCVQEALRALCMLHCYTGSRSSAKGHLPEGGGINRQQFEAPGAGGRGARCATGIAE